MSKRSVAHTKHVHVCRCGRKVAGNAYWQHRKHCAVYKAERREKQ
jgi:hypothetical protein